MNSELIERLAVEAGMYIEGPTSGQQGLLRADAGDLMRFAALVAEECARVADAVPPHTWIDGIDQFGQPCPVKVVARPRDAAKAIRAKFKEP